MTKPIVLVTGAAGKTGRPVVRQFLERGYHVRAPTSLKHRWKVTRVAERIYLAKP